MKIYGTITSERASKSQGGNEFLLITVVDEDRKPLAEMHIQGGYCRTWKSDHLKDWNQSKPLKPLPPLKAEKKKAECYECKGTKFITDNEGDQYCENIQCEHYK